jgi:hypothetical protein
MPTDIIQAAEVDSHGAPELRALQHAQIYTRFRKIIKMAKNVRTIVIHYDKPIPFTFIKELQLPCKTHAKKINLLPTKKNYSLYSVSKITGFFFSDLKLCLSADIPCRKSSGFTPKGKLFIIKGNMYCWDGS